MPTSSIPVISDYDSAIINNLEEADRIARQKNKCKMKMGLVAGEKTNALKATKVIFNDVKELCTKGQPHDNVVDNSTEQS